MCFQQSLARNLCLLLTFALMVQSIQAQTLKPEVMLVIDTSASMEEVNDSFSFTDPVYPPVNKCRDISQGVQAPADTSQFKTKMHTILEFLTGKANGSQACASYGATYRANNHLYGKDGNVGHYRLFCRPVNEPGNWIPCWKDFGAKTINDPDNPSNKTPDLISSGLGSGLLGMQLDQVKFGLMTADSHPWSDSDLNGDYSFGEKYDMRAVGQIQLGGGGVNNNPIYNTLFGQIDLKNVSNALGAIHKIVRPPLSIDPNDPVSYLDYFYSANQKYLNLGVRNQSAVIGPLIDPNLGTESNKALAIDESFASITAHNTWVRKEIQKLVPFGSASLSAMLEDLSYYYKNIATQPSSCRQKIVVLVTDGSEANFINSKSCTQNSDCLISSIQGPNPDASSIQGECVATPQTSSTTAEFLVRNPVCNNCPKVCSYPEGIPHQPAIETAKALYGLGIPVIVLTVGLPDINNPPANQTLAQLLASYPALAYAYKIAEAGSPFLGAKPDMPGIYAMTDSLDPNTLINRIKALAQRKVVSETQPLVLNTTKNDTNRGGIIDPNLRQWRMASYAEIPQGDTRGYGEINSVVLGCQGQQDTSMRLRQIKTISMASQLSIQTARPVFTNSIASTPANQIILPVIDVAGPTLFNSNGTGNNGYQDYIGNTLTANQVQNIGLQMAGYFGNRGVLNAATNPSKLKRSPGGFNYGDLLGISPPVLYSQKAGFVNAYQKLKTRPSLVITGADDGMIHVWRAYDGINLFSVVPKISWNALAGAKNATALPIDGPLAYDDIIPCRAVGNGGANCPDIQNATLTTMVVGGVGNAGANLFGFELGLFDGEDLRDNPPRITQWPNGAKMWNFTNADEPMLGLSVSRPAITHVKVNGQLKAAVIVGCGDDSNSARSLTPVINQIGRCVLVIDAMTGALIKKIVSNDINFPMIGGVSAFPQGYGATSDQAFLGDKAGQLWRIDFKTDQPNDWTIQQIWPLPILLPANRPDLNKKVGFAIEERPSLSLRSDGRLTIIFATAKTKVTALPPGKELGTQGYMVSMNQKRLISDAGVNTFEYTGNWAMDFSIGEYSTGAPKVQDGVVYITTAKDAVAVGQACGALEGKLYGVHYTDSYDQDYMDTNGNRLLRVKPMLPRYEANGTRKSNGLSLILPPGRVSYGFAMVATPPCNPSGAIFNELILNLSQTQEQAALQLNGLSVDYLDGANPNAVNVGNNPPGVLMRAPLATDLEVKATGSVVNVVMAPPPNTAAAAIFRASNPFPAELFYWGNGLNP